MHNFAMCLEQNISPASFWETVYQLHRIREQTELEGTHHDHWIQLFALFRIPQGSHHIPGFYCPNTSWTHTGLVARPLLLFQLFQCSLAPVTDHHRGEISICLSSSPHEKIVDCNEVSPKSPPGWTNQEISSAPHKALIWYRISGTGSKFQACLVHSFAAQVWKHFRSSTL